MARRFTGLAPAREVFAVVEQQTVVPATERAEGVGGDLVARQAILSVGDDGHSSASEVGAVRPAYLGVQLHSTGLAAGVHDGPVAEVDPVVPIETALYTKMIACCHGT